MLYRIVLLDTQYPPNLDKLSLELPNIDFLFIVSMFKPRVSNKRFVYSFPFYAYTYDNSFRNFRITTFNHNNRTLLIYTPRTGINPSRTYLALSIKLNHDPIIKNYLYKGLLRFRWHHTNDIFFVTYDIMVLFAVA